MEFSVNLSRPTDFDPLFGRTAVRPYKKKMILNAMTDEEDR
jgi:hypothetical protein